MGDQDQCHRSTKKTARPILTLGGERCEWTDQPIANYRIRERFLKEEAERLAASEAARERAQQSKFQAQNRRKLREELAANREENEHRFAERRRKTWIALVREATNIGLKPDPRWTEREFRLEIWDRKQDIRREEEERAREEYWAEEKRRTAEQRLFWQRQQQEEAARFLAKVWEWSVARNRELKRPADLEELGDLWEHIPHVARHGICRRNYDWYCRRIGWDYWSYPQELYQARGRCRKKLARAMVELLGQKTGLRSNCGRGMRPQQKQRRTWEAEAPQQWRRKDHCAGRWAHLFIIDPAAE